jgi:hypothetical protein
MRLRDWKKMLLPVCRKPNPREPEQQHREERLGFGDIAALSRHAFLS